MKHQNRDRSNTLNEKQFSGSIQTDEQLWSFIKNGDTEAMALLFKRYYVMLFDYAFKFTHREDWAKDAIQGVFVYLWEESPRLDFTYSVKSYLFRSVRNRLLNEINRKNRHFEKQQELREFLPTIAFSPEEMLLGKEKAQKRKRIVQQALKQIPARQREILYLKVFHNLSYKEIAAITSLAPQTARNHVSEAYKRLYEILSPEMIETR